MSDYRDGFDVVQSAAKTQGGRGATLKCKQCGKVTKSNWGMSKRHAQSHQNLDSKPPTQPKPDDATLA